MMEFRKSNNDDIPFLKRMLYEAIFWSDEKGRPTFEEAFKLPFVEFVLKDWGKRKGDLALVAIINQKPVGAAWIRFFAEDEHMRGYIDETIPVLVIGIKDEYRHQGIGGMLLQSLNTYAREAKINQISLCVSKKNYAQKLYHQHGFKIHQDIGDSLLMQLTLRHAYEV